LLKPSSEIISLANQASISQDHLVANMSGENLIHSRHSIFSSISTFQKASAIPNHPWILDTRATDHMICSISYFTTIIAIVSKFIKLPNGQFASVTHIGIVHISTSLVLTDVLLVPSFSFNLVSISKLTKLISCCLIFFSNFCFIQHLLTWNMIGMGRECGGLFHLMFKPMMATRLVNEQSYL
jgi:hypothetical protein